MTDREPDDLFDALRDRLADYGQEPPAPLWAGIRAQLPPPVARPQLRRRKRRAAWVLLLLLIGSVGSWQLWRVGQHHAASQAGQTASGPAARHTQPEAADNEAAQHTASTGTAGDAGRSQAAAGAPAAALAAEEAAGNRPASALATAKARQAASAAENLPQLTTKAPATTTSGRLASSGRSTTGTSTMAPGSTAAGGAAAAPETGVASRSTQALASRKAQGGSSSILAGAAAHLPAATSSPGAATSSLAAARAPKPTSYTTPKNVLATDAASGVMRPSPAQPYSAAATHALAPAAPASAAASQAEEAPQPQIEAVSFVAWNRLPARLVALQPAPAATAAGQPQPVAHQPAAPALAPRWAVQVLAGPALTYRRLSTSASLMTPHVTSSSTAAPSSTTHTVADLERPALGYGGQVSLRRVLNGRWSLSAGLGYAEYGTRLAIQRVGSTPAPISNALADSLVGFSNATTTIHRRDTYRFVTVPVRLSYRLLGGLRWQLGLQGGAEVAAYLGGTSTEGATCACQTQTWGATGTSPYRRLSVGASLGAELRYHLTDRWSLLAQPTATYFLSSLPKPAATTYQRYLFGGTALLGASYDLP